MTASTAVLPSVPDPRPGMCVATLMLEDSRGGMQSLGGNGDDHELCAGDLHWGQADAGIMRAWPAARETAHQGADHSEGGHSEGARLNGLRMVLDLSGFLADQAPERIADSVSDPQPEPSLPATPSLLRAWEMPVIQTDAGRIRVVAGSHAGRQSPLLTPAPIAILDAWLRPGATQLVPLAPGWNAWVYAVSGALGVRARHRRIGAPPLPRQAGGDPDFAVLEAGSALIASALAGEDEGVLVLMAGRAPAHFVLMGHACSAGALVSRTRRRGGAKSLAA